MNDLARADAISGILRLEFPGILPNPQLCANNRARLKWWERAGIVAAERAKWAALLADWSRKGLWQAWIATHAPPYRLEMVVRLVGHPLGDNDGWVDAAKPLRDALGPAGMYKRKGGWVMLTGVGLIPDDGPKVIAEYEVQVERGNSEPSTVVLLWRVEAEW